MLALRFTVPSRTAGDADQLVQRDIDLAGAIDQPAAPDARPKGRTRPLTAALISADHFAAVLSGMAANCLWSAASESSCVRSRCSGLIETYPSATASRSVEWPGVSTI